MLEAWLLFDEQAIRRAAGNPKGRSKIKLPSLKSIERLADPKKTLFEALRDASNKRGRRYKNFRRDEREVIHRLAEIIGDFSPLYQLSAFKALEEDLSEVLKHKGWLE